MPGFLVSNAAANDLRGIARYTQDTWGREQRRRYLDGLNRKFDLLAEMPELSPERRDFQPPVRLHRHERHLVIYLVTKTGILIVRVLHQSQDVPAHIGRGNG